MKVAIKWVDSSGTVRYYCGKSNIVSGNCWGDKTEALRLTKKEALKIKKQSPNYSITPIN